MSATALAPLLAQVDADAFIGDRDQEAKPRVTDEPGIRLTPAFHDESLPLRDYTNRHVRELDRENGYDDENHHESRTNNVHPQTSTSRRSGGLRI